MAITTSAKALSYEIQGNIAIITIDSPPVNALGFETRTAIDEGFRTAWADESIKAIVFLCAGRTYIAGADISEFGKPAQGPDLFKLFAEIEKSPIPVITAIHGTALGGGLEFALNCHYRLVVPSAKVGLPEVHLGLLPGAGGTQRIPRLMGVSAALDFITSGRMMKAVKAVEAGIIDQLIGEDTLRQDTIAFARSVLDQNMPLKRIRDLEDKIASDRGNLDIYEAFRTKNARKFRGFKAPENIILAIQAAAESKDFDAGMAREKELFEELLTSKESAAQIYAFFAQRQTAKIPDVPKDTPVRDIKSVGVIGAGTMGGGITMNFLSVGLPVTLVERNQEALDRGVSVIRKNYENSAKKGRMTTEQVEACMALITPTTNMEDLSSADLIIEAVFEEMSIKEDIFGNLDRIAKQGAILASNTSFLDLDQIAAATKRPQDVIGLHFFSPANVMPLLEIVRGAKTGKDLIATAMKLSKKIGKMPVLAGVCDGFIANRAMDPRAKQASAILLEGADLEQIDRVIYEYGFAMGPFQMMDLIGLDVLDRGSNTKTVDSQLVAMQRLGQKKNGGYYDYDERRQRTLSPIIADLVKTIVSEQSTPQKTFSDQDILERLLFPVVNEGAKILEEGIAIHASHVDMALVKGYNWPIYTGGPMFWADQIGLDKIVAKMREYEAEYGETFAPSKLLVKHAEAGTLFCS